MYGRSGLWPLLIVALVAPQLVKAATPPPKPSPAVVDLRRHFNDAGINVLTFHTMDSIFDTLPVKASGRVSALAEAKTTPNFTYSFGGQTHRFEDFFDRTFTNALLIIKDDKVVFERYRNFTGPSDRFLSMSMAKSFTSVLVGIALQEGKIASIDDQVTKYLPQLRGTPYDGVTIRDALLMRSGLDDSDDYQPAADTPLGKFREAQIRNEIGALGQVAIEKRADEPGKTFRYLTLNTSVLGAVLEKATGQPLPVYMSERLWKPLGAQADAFWLDDGAGAARNGMGFNATLRDYGRFGLMMLHDGKANGRQIVPAAWVKASTTPTTQTEPAAPGARRGYQYQWWTLLDSNAYMAIGLQGQYIYVDPDTKTVVVKLSYFPLSARDPDAEAEAFFRAVSAWKP